MGLAAAMAVVGILIAAELAVPLQPGFPCANCSAASGAEIVLPAGVGSNLKLNYSPARAVVIIGQNDTVTFVNQDTATHTVTATDGSFSSGDIVAGGSWTHSFTAPGNYTYYCVYHSAWMKGEITVKASGGPAGPTVAIPAGTGSNLQQTYQPASLKVVVGVNNTVTFANHDGVPHTVTASDGSFDSGTIAPGGSWTHTFAKAGTFNFVCTFHSWMKGTITVAEGA